jgi:site-specific recombinase XerD
MIGVHVGDVVLDASPCVHLRGKGRKRRSVPLWTSTVQAIRAWLRRNPSLGADAPLLPNRNGRTMTRSNVNKRLDIAVARAAPVYPNLTKRHISPHSVRHSTAMHMLQSGVAFSVIALWLGHENMTTTHRYVEADLAMKKAALARLQEPGMEPARFQPSDALMQFLQTL